MADPGGDHLFYMTRRRAPRIARARGVRLWDVAGREYLDGCSGAIICSIGYGDARVAAAVQRQAQSTFYAYRLHFENDAAEQLAARLADHAAPHLDRAYFVSGGSEAVETAMKLCRQYFFERGEGGRSVFISRTPAYHGCTLGALALTSYAPVEIPFRPLIAAYPKIPAPTCYRCAYGLTHPACDLACARRLETVIQEQGPANVAAFVAEPIGGASTGAVVPPDGYFDVIQRTCRRYGIMLILDEVMTAPARTGALFAYEHWDVEADIVALSKGLAAGYFPLGAVLTRRRIVDTVLSRSGFAHGFTYAGNPMACAVGREVFDIVTGDGLTRNAAVMGEVLHAALTELAHRHAVIGDVRGRGLLQAVELVRDREGRTPFAAGHHAAQRLTDIAFEEGLIVYPRRTLNGLAGDHVMIAPPLIVTEEEVAELAGRLDRALQRLGNELDGAP